MSFFEKKKREELRQPTEVSSPDENEIKMIMNKLAPYFSEKMVLSLEGVKRRGERIEEGKFKRLTVRAKEQ